MSDVDAVAATWRPAPVSVTGLIDAGATGKLAALLGVSSPPELPPLWHEVHLREAVGPAELGPDGHPRDGVLLPPLTDRRRLFGGGTVEQVAPLVVGDVATRTAQVVDVRVRQGRSGTLLLVTEEHRWTVGGRERIRERRDIVYRQAGEAGRAAGGQSGETGSSVGSLVADERYLFAYSALTYNLHRIHYDAPYARDVEHHPALVVHGPLLALWCAEHARHRLGAAPTLLTYRLTSTAYVGQAVDVTSSGSRSDSDSDVGALVVEATSRGRTCVRMSVTA